MGAQELLEQLAELEHEQWSHWTNFLLSQLFPNVSLKQSMETIDQWKKQIETPYSELSEKEKESDRVWARKVLELINKVN